MRDFLYAWLMSRIIVPVIAPEEGVSIQDGLIRYLVHRYQEFLRSLFWLPLMKILVIVGMGGILSWLLSVIGLLEFQQELMTYLLPVAGFPVIAQAMSPALQLTPMPIGVLLAYGLVLQMRLAPIGLALPRYGFWPIPTALLAGICLLGRTQLFSGVEFDAWPTWPAASDLVGGLISIAVGTIPPLTIAYFERRASGRRQCTM